jgi:hypothetical protein
MLQLRLNMTIFTVEWGFWPHCNNDGRCFFVTKRNKHLLKIENVIFICNDIASTSLTSNNGSTCKDIKKWGYIMLYYLHIHEWEERNKNIFTCRCQASRTTLPNFVQTSIKIYNREGLSHRHLFMAYTSRKLCLEKP